MKERVVINGYPERLYIGTERKPRAKPVKRIAAYEITPKRSATVKVSSDALLKRLFLVVTSLAVFVLLAGI